MKIKLIPIILFLSTILLFNSCIDILEFQPERSDYVLVVDGKITSSPGPYFLKLNRTAELGKSAFLPETGAYIRIIDGSGKQEDYSEIQPGVYRLLGSTVKGEQGQSYTLRIELENGTIYESKPEVMPPSVPVERMFFTVGKEIFEVNGNIRSQYAVNVYIDVVIPEVDKGPFLRWEMENLYMVSEVFCGPFDPTNTCYIQDFYDDGSIVLLDGRTVATNATHTQKLTQKTINQTFGQKQYFNTFQSSISQEAFEYWSEVDQLTNQVGSIFDAAPAPIRGNLYNVDDEDEIVLGYFEAAAVDTARVFTTALDVRPQKWVNPMCGWPGFLPRPFPDFCCECLLIENSTYERPDYW